MARPSSPLRCYSKEEVSPTEEVATAKLCCGRDDGDLGFVGNLASLPPATFFGLLAHLPISPHRVTIEATYGT